MEGQFSIYEKASLESPKPESEYRLKIQESCLKCASANFYTWGTKIDGRFNIEIRCIRCGAVIQRSTS